MQNGNVKFFTWDEDCFLKFNNFKYYFVISMPLYRVNEFYMSRYLLTLFFVFLMHGLKAQNSLSDISGQKPDYRRLSEIQVRTINEFYVHHVNIADELINGKEYIPYYFKCRDKPLFYDEIKRTGSVVLNGRRYDSLMLEYDTYLDQLVYSDFRKLINYRIFKISLNKDIVSEFSLYFENDTVLFRNFKSGRDSRFNLPEGYYEIIYDGISKFIIRHQSFYMESEGLFEYRYNPVRYVSVGGNFEKVRSASGFRKMFGEKANEVRKFMRTRRIRFAGARRSELAAVMKYYDSLIAPGNK